MLSKKLKFKTKKPVTVDAEDRDDQQIDEEQLKKMELQDAEREQPLAMDEKTLERIRNMTREEQEKEDADIAEGVRYFFDNEYTKAEQMFERRAAIEPLAALAHGIMQLVRAMLSFIKEDMDLAAQRLTHAERLANAVCPSDSYLTSMAKMIRIKGKKKWTNAQMRANMVKALSNALYGMTLLVQESMVLYMKAGLAFRKAYNKLTECDAELSAAPQDYDNNCVGCIYFAVGLVNIALSAVPPKILKLLSIMGYPCDRAKGFELLEKSIATNSYASPFAQTSLLVHRGCVPALAPILLPEEMPKALATLAIVREKYPKSCIHLHIAGRIARAQKDMVQARSLFEAAVSEQKELVQLKHAVIYDLAWTDFVELKFDQAAERFGYLAAENKWSKCFYTFLQATALEMAGQREQAIKLYKAAPPLSTQKFGGKRMPHEQFVLKRVASFEAENFDTIVPGLEVMVLSNMYCQMSQDCVERYLAMAEARLAEMVAKDEQDPDRLGIIWLILACLHKELGHFDPACELFKQIYDVSEDILDNTYVVPFALYEHGCMLAIRGHETSSLDMLKEAQQMLLAAKDEFHDYTYEVRLGFKLLLSLPLINNWISQLGGKARK